MQRDRDQVGEADGVRQRRLQALNDITMAIGRERNLERVVQLATDAATDLSGASYGAVFYNLTDGDGEHYMLYTLSGAARADFARLGLPRNTPLFDPTFHGQRVIRSDDIRADPRYGRNAPYQGMPEGHLPVVSYLAAPVVSITGEVHGGLFLGHGQAGVFDAEAEAFAVSLAAHVAVAIDSFRLLGGGSVEIERQRRSELAAHRLAAIVESSFDAILAKDLDGIVTSWNDGARRLFGYSGAEIVGKPATTLMPADRLDEEVAILASIRRGERIEPHETVRLRKDGSLVDVSVSVSPIRGPDGFVVGASTIARDITDLRMAEERRNMLIRELHHRVKNSFALASSIVSLSARSATTVAELVSAVRERLVSLSRAQTLTLPQQPGKWDAETQTSLHAIIREVVEPLAVPSHRGTARLIVRGADVPVLGHAVTPLALLLNELASNAAKHGALSTESGQVEIECAASPDTVNLVWREAGGPAVESPPAVQGFGSRLLETTVQGQLGGAIARQWQSEGLIVRVALSRRCVAPPPAEAYAGATSAANM